MPIPGGCDNAPANALMRWLRPGRTHMESDRHMGQQLIGRQAIRAKQIRPGEAFAARVPLGGLIEIVDLDGKQVAELIAFNADDPAERLSLGVTRRRLGAFFLQLDRKLYSTRGNEMLELVEDTVGRHDLLWSAETGSAAPAALPASDDASPEHNGASDGGHNATEDGAPPNHEVVAGFRQVLEPFGLADCDPPDPVNFFMQVAIMQQGTLELREPLSERGDRVMLSALGDVIVAVRSSSATDETNGSSPSDLLVRVYR